MKTSLVIFSIFFLIGTGTPLRAAEIDSLSVEPMINRAEKTSIYVVRFSCNDSIPATARWEISFPAEFDLSRVKMAGSNTITGGFFTRVVDHTVLISRSGKGLTLKPEVVYDLMFANVKNAPSGDYPIGVRLLDQNGGIIADKKTAIISIQM